MLVATGAAAFVLLSIKVSAGAPNIDVTRITAQVVMGVGFLGAGVIFREGPNLHGLNSAATIWCSAAIGCIAASGYFVESLICTFLVTIVNTVLEPVDQWLRNRK
jgi:putative Mg2+ transporter-C (MgtC) family protein